ncbi:MAG: hypothetical protein ACI945_002131 [Pseudohongiellaceae bacterium]|jgi:hypothetical protein
MPWLRKFATGIPFNYASGSRLQTYRSRENQNLLTVYLVAGTQYSAIFL